MVNDEAIMKEISSTLIDLYNKNFAGEVYSKIKLNVANWFGVAIGSLSFRESVPFINIARKEKGDFKVIGGLKSTPYLSTLVNASLAHLLDFDDTHLKTILHPGTPVIASALTSVQFGMGKFLNAIALGEEMAIRLGLAMDISNNSKWHYTGALGGISSSITSSLLLKLSEEEMVNAISLSSAFASGFERGFGTHAKAYGVGRAAAEGIISSLSAKDGIKATPKFLRVFAETVGKGIDFNTLIEGLGRKWHLLDNVEKPYACGVVLHPVIEASSKFKEGNYSPSSIREIVVKVNPKVMELCGNLNPKSGLEAKFSVNHAVVLGVIFGKADPSEFSEEVVNNEDIVKLRGKVKVSVDEGLKRGDAEVTFKLIDNEEVKFEVKHGEERASKMPSEEDIKRKFSRLTFKVIGEERAESLWKAIMSCEREKGVEDILDLI